MHVIKIFKTLFNSLLPEKEGKYSQEKIKGYKYRDIGGGYISFMPFRDEDVKRFIYSLKYENNKKSISLASEMFKTFLKNECSGENNMLCTIPAAKTRKVRGEDDHMRAISKKILSDKEIKMMDGKNVLEWNRDVKRQSAIKRRVERIENVKEAMIVKKIIPKDIICIVLDDVTTTRSTLREARRALREKGVEEIITVTLSS